MIQTKGYAAHSADSGLTPFKFDRNEPAKDEDLIIK